MRYAGLFAFLVALAVFAAAGYGIAFGVKLAYRDVLGVCVEKHIIVVDGVPYRCTFEEIKE
jgi:hypothetical protein